MKIALITLSHVLFLFSAVISAENKKRTCLLCVLFGFSNMNETNINMSFFTMNTHEKLFIIPFSWPFSVFR
jgi:hypothetical protein